MTTDFTQQLELPSPPARTAKNAARDLETLCQSRRTILRTKKTKDEPFLLTALPTVEDWSLRKRERDVLNLILTKPDHWNTDGLAAWLTLEFAGRYSERTIQYAIAGLRQKRYLRRTLRTIWVRGESVWQRGYQVFEVPFEEPENFDPDAYTFVETGKYCDGRRPPGYRHRAFGTMEGDRGAPATGSKTVTEGCKNLHPRNEWKGILHTSEYPGTPPPPIGGQEILDDLRVSRNDGKPAHHDKPARRAKRQKGRSSQGRPHNARQMKPKKSKPQFPQLSRLYINLGNYRATPDAAEFMQNLPTQLKPARKALRDLPDPNTQPWLDALMANPLLSVAQDVFGYENWSQSNLRSFLKALGKTLSVYDLLLCWVGVQGRWSSDTVWDMRCRLTKRWCPTEPDYRRSQVCPDLIMEVHNWHRHVDGVRESLSEQCTKPVAELLAGVDLDNPETIKTHPMLWTAILASPVTPEEMIDADVVELARRTLVPVAREEFTAWIDDQSCRMLCRWNGRFCVGELETVVGRGICKVVEEWYEFDMINPSGHRGSRGDYSHATEARVATLSHFD
jgi:hypothetical protein